MNILYGYAWISSFLPIVSLHYLIQERKKNSEFYLGLVLFFFAFASATLLAFLKMIASTLAYFSIWVSLYIFQYIIPFIFVLSALTWILAALSLGNYPNNVKRLFFLNYLYYRIKKKPLELLRMFLVWWKPEIQIIEVITNILDAKSFESTSGTFQEELAQIDDTLKMPDLILLYEDLARKLMLTQIAKILSIIFHPFLMVPVTLFFTSYFMGQTLLKSLMWAGIFVLFSLLPVLIVIIKNVGTGKYSDFDVSIQRERTSIYIVTLLSLITVVYLFIKTSAPNPLLGYMYAILSGGVVMALINRFITKVSAHAYSNASCFALVFIVLTKYSLIFGCATILVSWSRVVLKHHTFKQVVLGVVLGIISVALSLLALGEYYVRI